MKENIKSFNLFNSKIIIFILVFVFVLIGIIIHNLFKNEEKIPYNFQPYPKFSPKNIPSINLGNDNTCYSILTKCINGNCPNCTDDFECVNVENEGQFIINNTSVPVGEYCLPKVNKNDCNQYTGSWVWVNEPEYCGDKGDQCWKCVCKYPDLYDNYGNITDCSDQKACNTPIIPTSINANSANNEKLNTNNRLVSTKALNDSDKNIPIGTQWNPLISTSDPNIIEALKINPYGKSEDGKPYFQCDCSKDDIPQLKQYPYVSLPNDPYVCNTNICDPISKVSQAKAEYDVVSGTIKCNCASAGLDIIGGDDNLYANTCINGNTVCNEFLNCSADTQSMPDGNNVITGCNCSKADAFSQQCISMNVNIHKKQCNDDWSDDRLQSIPELPNCNPALTGSLPPCANPQNMIGFECRSACSLSKNNKTCLNGGKRTFKTTDSGKTCNSSCNCPDGFRGDVCGDTCIKLGVESQYCYVIISPGGIPELICSKKNDDCCLSKTNCAKKDAFGINCTSWVCSS